MGVVVASHTATSEYVYIQGLTSRAPLFLYTAVEIYVKQLATYRHPYYPMDINYKMPCSNTAGIVYGRFERPDFVHVTWCWFYRPASILRKLRKDEIEELVVYSSRCLRRRTVAMEMTHQWNGRQESVGSIAGASPHPRRISALDSFCNPFFNPFHIQTSANLRWSG